MAYSGSFQEDACKLYRELAQLPLATSARIFPSGSGSCEVEVNWSQRDLDRGKKVCFAKSYILQSTQEDKYDVVIASNFQRDATSICMESYSVTGGMKATLVKDKTSKAEKTAEPQQFIEIWQSNCLVKSLNVKEQFGKKHGDINDDDQFASFQLSFDGTKLLYIAEKKIPEGVSYFKKVSGEEKEKKEGESDKEPGSEYKFRENWGERLTSVVQPVVAVIDLSTEECTIVDCPENLSCGLAQWVPHSNNELVFIGYDNFPLKLGFVFCFNRKSTLFVTDLEKNSSTALMDNNKYIYSPRFNPQGNKLVFFECDADLPTPHRACARLRQIDWKTKTVTTLIDVINKPTETGFTGIYAFFLPKRCWGPNGRYLYYSGMQMSLHHVLRVDTITGDVHCMTAATDIGTYNVLDVWNGLIVVRYSNPAHPTKILVAKLPNDSSVGFKQTDFCEIASIYTSLSEKIKWRIIDLNRKGGGLPYQSIFVSPVSSPSPPPLIVFPHGGPHAGSFPDFITWNACFVALGFAVLLVNYNGSMGFGQDAITSLLGEVGTLDIQDTQYAAETIVKNGEADGERMVVTGGSHGGFITAHLIGQYPDSYKAAFIRNPVIDIASMCNVSDIPDWSHSVVNQPYDPASPPTPEIYANMLNASPIIHVKKVKASVIIVLGGEDRRCPPSQGKELYFTLKAQGKDVELYWYPKDSHPLWSVDTDADCFMHCALLFYKHCMK